MPTAILLPYPSSGDSHASREGRDQGSSWSNTTLRIGDETKNAIEHTAFMAFDARTLPAGAKIVDAYLQITSASTVTTELDLRVAVVNQDGTWEDLDHTGRWHRKKFGGIAGCTLRDTGGTVTGLSTITAATTSITCDFDRDLVVFGQEVRRGASGLNEIKTVSFAAAITDFLISDVDVVVKVFDPINGDLDDPIATSEPKSWNTIQITTPTNTTWTFTDPIPFTAGDQLAFVVTPAATVNEAMIFNVENASVPNPPLAAIRGRLGPQPEHEHQFHYSGYLAEIDFPHISAQGSDTVRTTVPYGGSVFPSNSTFYSTGIWTAEQVITFGDAATAPDHVMTGFGALLQDFIDEAEYTGLICIALVPKFITATGPAGEPYVSLYSVDDPSATTKGPRLVINYTAPVPTPGTGPTDLVPFRASETSIANAALTLLGERRIDSLNDGSVTANLIVDRFADIRDALLRMVPWNFATKRASLAANAQAPEWGHQHAYTLPDDFIRLLDVDDVTSRLPYEVEGRNIVTGIAPPLSITYVARVTDPASWDPLFRDCLAAFLAVELAEAVTGGAKFREVFEVFVERFVSAGVVNGQEEEPMRILATEWQAARGRDEPR